METGELKRRRTAKAHRLLESEKPYFTTTEALCLIDANCGPARFHRLLVRRGWATLVQGSARGYNFSLPAEYGGGAYSIDHHSFHWTPQGVRFIATILGEEGVDCRVPAKLSIKIDGEIGVHQGNRSIEASGNATPYVHHHPDCRRISALAPKSNGKMEH